MDVPIVRNYLLNDFYSATEIVGIVESMGTFHLNLFFRENLVWIVLY